MYAAINNSNAFTHEWDEDFDPKTGKRKPKKRKSFFEQWLEDMLAMEETKSNLATKKANSSFLPQIYAPFYSSMNSAQRMAGYSLMAANTNIAFPIARNETIAAAITFGNSVASGAGQAVSDFWSRHSAKIGAAAIGMGKSWLLSTASRSTIMIGLGLVNTAVPSFVLTGLTAGLATTIKEVYQNRDAIWTNNGGEGFAGKLLASFGAARKNVDWKKVAFSTAAGAAIGAGVGFIGDLLIGEAVAAPSVNAPDMGGISTPDSATDYVPEQHPLYPAPNPQGISTPAEATSYVAGQHLNPEPNPAGISTPAAAVPYDPAQHSIPNPDLTQPSALDVNPSETFNLFETASDAAQDAATAPDLSHTGSLDAGLSESFNLFNDVDLPQPLVHDVVAGENLSVIGHKYWPGLSYTEIVEKILSDNPQYMGDPNLIHPGDHIVISPAEAMPSANVDCDYVKVETRQPGACTYDLAA